MGLDRIFRCDSGFRMCHLFLVRKKILYTLVMAKILTLLFVVLFSGFQLDSMAGEIESSPLRKSIPNSGDKLFYKLPPSESGVDFVVPIDGDLTVEDRKVSLDSGGIPAEPLPVYTEGPNGNEAVVLVGKEDLPIKVSVAPKPSYWFQEDIR